MSTIKLAWDNSFAARNLTGTGVYAARLLEALRRIEGLQIEVFDGWNSGAHPSGVMRRVQTLGNLVWMRTALPSALRTGRFDLLHCPAFIAPRRSPCPVVITMHDITYRLYPSAFAWWWVRFMNATMPAAAHAAAAIICPSECSKRDVVKAYSLPPDRVHVVLHGVDHELFSPTARLDQAWARRLGIREGYLLHVGELSQRKNIPSLLRAVALLREKGRWGARQVVLAGTHAPGMPGAAEIHDTIARLGLADWVVLAGRVPDERLPGLYANAALLAMPSWYEGFGLPVLESMASGTPVVCSNVSSLPEVAGDAGILVPPTDVETLALAIAEILENPALAEELRQKGLNRARQFNWKLAADATARVYRSVVR